MHRIGRTGRAGAAGTAFSFCDLEEREYLRDIQRVISLQIPVVEEHPYPMPKPVDVSKQSVLQRQMQMRAGGRRRF